MASIYGCYLARRSVGVAAAVRSPWQRRRTGVSVFAEMMRGWMEGLVNNQVHFGTDAGQELSADVAE